MVPDSKSSVQLAGRVFSVAAVLAAVGAAHVLLFPNPLADVFFAGWVLVGVVLSIVGAVGAWTNRTALTWVAALLLIGLAGIGMMSIGMFIAPAAGLLIGAAIMTQLAGPRTGVHHAIRADPPTQQELVRKTVAGIGAAVLGGSLVYLGAISRELFEACARETLECAVARMNWGGVGITVLGLGLVGIGVWLVWKQIYIAWVLSTNQVQ